MHTHAHSSSGGCGGLLCANALQQGQSAFSPSVFSLHIAAADDTEGAFLPKQQQMSRQRETHFPPQRRRLLCRQNRFRRRHLNSAAAPPPSGGPAQREHTLGTLTRRPRRPAQCRRGQRACVLTLVGKKKKLLLLSSSCSVFCAVRIKGTRNVAKVSSKKVFN